MRAGCPLQTVDATRCSSTCRARTLPCLGVARPRPVGTAAIARPLLLAALALGVLVVPDQANLLALDVLAACGGLALYLAASEILAIPHPRWRTA